MGPFDVLSLIDIAKKFSDVNQANKENNAMEGYAKNKFLADQTNQGREDNAARRQALLNIMGYNTQIRPNRMNDPRLPYEAFKKSNFSQMLDVADEAGNTIKKKSAQLLPMMMGIPSPGIGAGLGGETTDLASAFA